MPGKRLSNKLVDTLVKFLISRFFGPTIRDDKERRMPCAAGICVPPLHRFVTNNPLRASRPNIDR